MLYRFFAFLFILISISTAWADEFEDAKDQLSNYKEQTKLLQQQKLARLFSRDFNQLAQNIMRADQLLAAEEEEAFQREVGMIRLRILLIEVSIHELEDKEKVQKVQDQVITLDEKIKKVRQEIRKLETQLSQGNTPSSPARPNQVPPNQPVNQYSN